MQNRLLVALFAVGIFLPGLALVTGLFPGSGLTEKRELATLPALPSSAMAWERYPREVEAYYNDHFGFRALLIRSYNLLFRTWLQSGGADVLVGRNGWYYVLDAAVHYRIADPFTVWELEAWRRNLEERHDFATERGITFLFVVVPNKDTLYPEYLPDAHRREPERTRLDQLVDHLARSSDVPVLDLRAELTRAKSRDGIVYMRTDTHWNDLGAHAGYAEVARRLGVPGLEPLPREAFEVARTEGGGGDLTALLALSDSVRDEWVTLEPRETRRAREVPPPDLEASAFLGAEQPMRATEIDDPTLPRAVVFRDSFAARLVPFLSEHFSRVLYVWSDNFEGEIVAAERPDVVICEIAERKLLLPPPENSELVAGRRALFEKSDVVLRIDAGNARETLQLEGDLAWAEGAALEVQGRRSRADLPALPPVPDERVFVRVAYEASADTHARLYYGVTGESGFVRERSLRRRVRAGSLEFYFEVPARIWDGRLAFSPGRVPGAYPLQAIEVGSLAIEAD